MTRRTCAILSLLFVLAACSSPALSGRSSSGKTVETTRVEAARSYRFAPTNIQVHAGDTVTWTNTDNFVHTVHVIDSNITKDLRIGGVASIVFDRPGLVRYQCSLHPAQMNGSVLVRA